MPINTKNRHDLSVLTLVSLVFSGCTDYEYINHDSTYLPSNHDAFVNYDRYLLECAATAGIPFFGAKDWQGIKEDLDGVYDNYLTKAEIEKIYWS